MALYLIENGESLNMAIKKITVTETSTFPDNGINYSTKIGYIPSSSILTVLSDTEAIFYIFNGDTGVIEGTKGYKKGAWIPL